MLGSSQVRFEQRSENRISPPESIHYVPSHSSVWPAMPGSGCGKPQHEGNLRFALGTCILGPFTNLGDNVSVRSSADGKHLGKQQAERLGRRYILCQVSRKLEGQSN